MHAGKSTNQLASQAKLAGIDCEKPLRLLLFETYEELATPFYGNLLSKLLPNSLVASTENGIVVVRNSELSGEEANPDTIEAITRFCKNYELQAGISTTFQRLEDLHLAFLQTKSILSLSKRLCHSDKQSRSRNYEPLLFYRNAPLCMMAANGDDRDALLAFLGHRNIITASLGREGMEKNDYLDLLYHYLYCSGRVSTISRLQGMHRNSTYYRLRKIEESLGMNLEDTYNQQYLRLLFDAMILEGTFTAPLPAQSN